MAYWSESDYEGPIHIAITNSFTGKLITGPNEYGFHGSREIDSALDYGEVMCKEQIMGAFMDKNTYDNPVLPGQKVYFTVYALKVNPYPSHDVNDLPQGEDILHKRQFSIVAE